MTAVARPTRMLAPAAPAARAAPPARERGLRVLVADASADLHALVSRTLEEQGHQVVAIKLAADVAAQLGSVMFDVVVLDVALPDRSGLEVCRELRENGVTTPILLVAAKAAIEQRIRGLDAGADDFLSKPFAIAELSARVRALARRGAFVEQTWSRDGVELDLPRRRATVAGTVVALTAREWNILDVLAAADGAVVPRSRVLDRVWGQSSDAAGASLDVLMTRLRKKLGTGIIQTIRGEGYALR